MIRFAQRKPLTIPELFDEAFGLYRRHFRELVVAGGLILFPAGLAVGFAQVIYQVVVLGIASQSSPAGPTGSLGALALAVSLMLALTSVYGLAAVFARGVLIASAQALHAGEPLGVRGAYAHVWSRGVSYILTEFLVGMAVGFASLFFIVPGIILWVLWSMAGQVVLAEDRSLFDAMNRSMSLVRGSGWRVFGTLMASGLLVVALQSIVTAPAQLLVFVELARNPEALMIPRSSILVSGAQGIMSALATVLVTPVMTLILAGLFVDLRLRKEGEDLLAGIDALD